MNRLKELREEKEGLYQEDIAKFLGVSIPAVSQYESGKRDMSTDTIIKLAEFFNVSTDYLLGKSDIRNPEKIDSDKINIGLSKKDYAPLTPEQQEKIEEFAKFVLKDNLKNKNK